MTLCTSTNCPYAKSCARQSRDDIDEMYDTYYNYELGGCDAPSGFPDFMRGDELELVMSNY